MATRTIEVPIRGMDCADCAKHVQHAIGTLAGVESVDVSLAAEKAVVRLDPAHVDVRAIREAVEGAGYTVAPSSAESRAAPQLGDFTRPILGLLGVVFGIVLFVVGVGERLGVFESVTRRVPWPVGLAIVLV